MTRVTSTRRLLSACCAVGSVALPGFGQPDPNEAPKLPETEAQQTAQAQRTTPTLNVGDPAPPLSVEAWARGEPVTELEPGRVYVISFWATWCGFCAASSPHLTRLQAHHQDAVRIIGVSSADRDLPTVQAHVARNADRMGYTVAFDADRSMRDQWMQAAGQTRIPCVFVVDRGGKVAWIGHPRVGLEAVLARVVDGTFDAAAWAKVEAKAVELRGRAFTAGEAGRFDEAAAALDELAALDPAFAADAGMMKFRVLLIQKRDYDAAYLAAVALLEGPLNEQPQSLYEVARMILDAEGVERRDVDVALRLAQRAADLDKSENAQILDTLARAFWLRGERDRAIEVQRKAVDKATSDVRKAEFAATLSEYQGK